MSLEPGDMLSRPAEPSARGNPVPIGDGRRTRVTRTRPTVGAKIVAGLAVVLGVGTLSMLIIYAGLAALQNAMRELADVKEPSSAAAYEMEINANGIGLAVLKYLDFAQPRYRRLVEEDEADFERFHARYLRLVQTAKEKELGDSAGVLYRAFKSLAGDLMDKKDDQEALFSTFGEDFERIDEIIDIEIQARVDRGGPDALQKVELVNDLEADIAEFAFWIANYQRAHKPEYKQFLVENEREFRGKLASFRSLELTAPERRSAVELGRIFERVISSTRDILAADDYLREGAERLLALREEIDRILDEEIQILALAGLYEPRREAERATAAVLKTVQYLIPLFVLSASVVALLLTRGVTGPVRTLKRGTEAISEGDFSHRINPIGSDELAELARHFNEMAERLQATTVSKELLEVSDEQLRLTVADLRREMDERKLAEEGRTRLQESLRRSETMSAMGSLVAGVAHEVRNPLFGISSTLDAMDARFAARDEYQRYMEVLRGQLQRLNDLMRELLEYGKPLGRELSPGSVAEVVAEAVRASAPVAQRSSVEIVNRVPQDLARVPMDRTRLIQVFSNLLDNAIQHSPARGRVVVDGGEVQADGECWVECAVRDSGPGFVLEDLELIFEPFFSRRRAGTGLGLSIVQRVVEAHGGQISAANEPQGGAVMTVRLPVLPADGQN